MGDDLDDLLNSVEKRLSIECSRDKVSRSERSPRLQRRATLGTKPIRNAAKKSSTDISDILDDTWLDDDDEEFRSKSKEMKPRKSVPNISCPLSSSWSDTQENKRLQQSTNCMRCITVYIGGSDCEKGICTSVSKRTCDRLRCTDCDFRVSIFDDHKWKEATDYLFLRNNMPDFCRLKSNLINKEGWRAYGCQCQWFNADHQVSLPVGLKWVCGKH